MNVHGVGLLVFGLMVIVNSHQHCATEYQAALQKVLDLKETCNEAVYKDCCEVSFNAFNRTMYNACMHKSDYYG